MFEIRRYADNDKNAWNAFVAQSKQGTFLFDRNYMDYHKDRFADYSLLFYKKDKLYALLPANVDGDTLWSHQGLTYGGLITDKHTTTAEVCTLFEELNAYLRGQGIRHVVYKPMPWIYQQVPAEEDLYAIFNRCHAQLMVRNVSSTIEQDRALKWRRIRQFGADKAEKEGIVVAQDDSAFTDFWQVLTDNLQHTYHTRPVHTLTEINCLHDAFPNNIRLYVARLDDKVIGGTVLFITPQVVHAQYISATEQGKHLHAIDAIFRKVLTEDYKDCRYFDFGISNEDRGRYLNEGLIYQKEGFGGRAVCYDWYFWNVE
jgi:hypothetical protein